MFSKELKAALRSAEPRGAAAKALNASLKSPCNSAVLRDAASDLLPIESANLG